MYQGSLWGRWEDKNIGMAGEEPGSSIEITGEEPGSNIEMARKELSNNMERAGQQDGDFIYRQTKTGN